MPLFNPKPSVTVEAAPCAWQQDIKAESATESYFHDDFTPITSQMYIFLFSTFSLSQKIITFEILYIKSHSL